MKYNDDIEKVVEKITYFDLDEWKDSSMILNAFDIRARLDGWSDIEIQMVLNQVREARDEDILEILACYCFKELENIEGLSSEDVYELLMFLEIHHHYLAEKPIEMWDEYDWSNFRVLRRKGTRALKYVHSIHPKSTKVAHKYELPGLAIARFDSYQKAKEFVIRESMEKEATIYSHFINLEDYGNEPE